MEYKYDVFSDRYNKILDLVSNVDDALAQGVIKYLSKRNKHIKICLRQERDYDMYDKGTYSGLSVQDNSLNFTYVTNLDNAYCATKLDMIPLNKKTICDVPIEKSENVDDKGLEVFSFSVRNSKEEPKLEIHVEQVANKYNFAVLSNKSFETKFVVDLKTDGNENYLIRSLKLVNGIECEKKEIVLSEMDMVDYMSSEDMRADDGRDFF